jgi:hypothetical protein
MTSDFSSVWDITILTPWFFKFALPEIYLDLSLYNSKNTVVYSSEVLIDTAIRFSLLPGALHNNTYLLFSMNFAETLAFPDRFAFFST